MSRFSPPGHESVKDTVAGIVCLSTPFLQAWPRPLGTARIWSAGSGVVLLLSNVVYLVLTHWIAPSWLMLGAITMLSVPGVWLLSTLALRIARSSHNWTLSEFDAKRGPGHSRSQSQRRVRDWERGEGLGAASGMWAASNATDYGRLVQHLELGDVWRRSVRCHHQPSAVRDPGSRASQACCSGCCSRRLSRRDPPEGDALSRSSSNRRCNRRSIPSAPARNRRAAVRLASIISRVTTRGRQWRSCPCSM